MRMNRLQGGGALLGLVLVGCATVASALTESRWVAVLFALGIFCVMTYLVTTARAALREIRTVKSNLGRGRKQQNDLIAAETSTHTERLRDVQRETHAVTTHVNDLADYVRQISSLSENAQGEFRAMVRDLQGRITELAAEVARLRGIPALRVWRGLAKQRREGVCCLLMGRGDASSILAVDDSPAQFEVWEPSDGTRAAAPATPAHAVGAVLVDLDLVVGATDGNCELGTFFRWLRPEVPIAGFTRAPGLLALRAADLSRLANGVLLSTPISANSVQFMRRADVPSVGKLAILTSKRGTKQS